MNKRTYAAVDIGSNSVRLMVARAHGSELEILHRARFTTRLMNGVHDGVLFGESVEATAQAVASHVRAARDLHADLIHAFGTSALRDARNPEVFTDRVKELCGAEVRIISGVAEAQLAYAGAAPEGKCGVIDIGGGSTELIVGENGQMLRAHSAQVGAVRLSNLLEGRQEPTEMIRAAEKLLRETVDAVCTDAPERWIGVGGTITTLAAMTKRVSKYTPDAINNFPLTEEAVKLWLCRLCTMTVEERCSLVGLQPSRADIIPYGTAILLAVMRSAKACPVYACDRDNLEGYIRGVMMNAPNTP